MNTLNGYSKSTLSDLYALTASGGHFPIHEGRNDNANKLVRTDTNGYLQAGWINTTSGGFNSAPDRVYASYDGYIRYMTPANFRAQVIGNNYWKVNAQTTAGTGDIYLEMWRGGNASWKMLNTGGVLKFQCNYTSSAGNYYDVFNLSYSSGNAWLKGNFNVAGKYLNVGHAIDQYAANRTEFALINNEDLPSMLELGVNKARTWGIEARGSADNNALSVYSWSAGAHVIRVLPNGNVGINVTVPSNKLEVGGNIMTTGALLIGSNTTRNYLAFYGTTNDGAGSFNHTYIGENIYGGTELSELILFKGNDYNSSSGLDRIRHIAAGHVFQIYKSALSGSFADICTSTVPVNVLTINLTKITASLPIDAAPERYMTNSLYGLNMGNSDIIGANAIYFLDAAGTPSEGLRFYVDGTKWDSLTASSGKVYFNPNANLSGDSLTPLFSALSNSGNNISMTIGGQNRTLTVNYATNADTVDNKHASDIWEYGTTISPYNKTTTGWYLFMTLSGIGADGLVDFIVSSREVGNLGIADYYHFEIRPGDALRKFVYTHLGSNNNKIRDVIYAYTEDNRTYKFYIKYPTIDTWVYWCKIKHISSTNCTLTYHNTWQTTAPVGTAYLATFSGAVDTATKLSTVSKTAWGQTYWTSGGVPTSISGNMTGVGSVTASGNFYTSVSDATYLCYKAANSNGAVGIYAATNRGLYDFTVDNWIVATNGTNSWLSRGNVGIGTLSPSYKLHVNGDSYTSGWSRAANGFYVLDKGVHYSANGTHGEIAMTSNNGFNWGASTATLYFNYNAASRGTTVTSYVWNAGSSSTYANHTLGKLTTYGDIIIKGSTTNVMTYDGNVHPCIRFDNSDSSLNIKLIFTDYDTYRSPAGIKLIGNQGNEWFEVDGYVYSDGLVKSGSSDSYVLLGGGGHKALSTMQSDYDARYVNVTGDTMSGPLTFTTTNAIRYTGSKSTYSMIRFMDNNVDTYGNGIIIGGGGTVVIGAGEAADTIIGDSAVGILGGTETTYIAADLNIVFYSNCNNGSSYKKKVEINTAGVLVSDNGITSAGAITLLNSSGGDSPHLVFQRGTASDGTYDWDQYVTGGAFKLRYNNSGTWTEVLSAYPSSITTPWNITASDYTATTGVYRGSSTLYLDSGTSGSSVIFRIGGVEKARFAQPNGYLGILTTSVTYPLTVNGVASATRFIASGTNLYKDAGGLVMNNSDIWGLNAIYTADLADGAGEGYLFKRSNGNYDSIWSADGNFYYSPNGNPDSGYGTNYTVIHSGNYTSYTVKKDGTGASGTWGINVSGNAATATKLKNYYSSRPASIAPGISGDGSMFHFKCTSSVTDTTTDPGDAHILHFNWDNSGGYDFQIAGLTSESTMKIRGMSSGTWLSWATVLTDKNSSVSGGGSSGGSSLTVNIGGTSKTLTIPTRLRSSKTFTPSGTATGWYRVLKLSTTNAGYNSNCIISIQRNYYSPLNEHYIFAISCGYNGLVVIKLLSGVIGGLLIPKIRVVYNNSGNCWIDLYKNSAGNASYTNTFCVELLAGDGEVLTPEIVSAAGGTAVEFTTVTGSKNSSNSYAAHFYENSDIKLKTNIENISTIDNVPLLKKFNWKSDGSIGYGLIAQELEEMGYPELVEGDESGIKTVNYSAALSLIVGKLQVKIRELEKEIENLKNKN